MVSSLPLCSKHLFDAPAFSSPHLKLKCGFAILAKHRFDHEKPAILHGENQCEHTKAARIELKCFSFFYFLLSGLTLPLPCLDSLQGTVAQVLNDVDKAQGFLNTDVAPIIKAVSGGEGRRVWVTWASPGVECYTLGSAVEWGRKSEGHSISVDFTYVDAWGRRGWWEISQ